MRILGLDIGSSSVKAVELNSAFRRFEIHDYHEVKFNEETSITDALALLVKGLAKKPDRVCAVLPSSYVTFRNLRLPTRDKRAIQSSLAFELEDELPFDLENSVYDFAIVSQAAGQSQVHVATALKDPFRDWLKAIEAGGLDPQLVTSESWAFRGLLNRIMTSELREKPVMLVQMGYRRTHLYVQYQGNPVIAREIPWGSWDIDRSIAEKFNVTIEEAEKTKHGSLGIILDDAAESSQKDVSEAIVSALDELTRELRQVHYATKNLTGRALAHAYVTGGASLLPGMRAALAQVMRIPVEELKVLSTLSNSGVAYTPENDAIYAPAIAAALCLVPQDKIRPINFRKGEFAVKKQEMQLNFSAYRKPLLGLCAVYVCGIASFVAQKSYYESKTEALDAQLERGMQSIFPGISKSATKTYLASPKKLKESIDKEVGSQRELSKLFGSTHKAHLAFLKGLSTQIPRDLVVDMVHFQVGSAPTQPFGADQKHEVEVSFLTKSKDFANRLIQIASRMLDSPIKTGPDESPSLDGKNRGFKITFKGVAKEDSYAK